jgi:methionyl-tRNA formyltransferase
MLQAAGELGLEVWSPPTVNADDAQTRLREQGADLLVVCDYGEILRPATLATTRLGGVNLHGSLLPKYRGAAPVQWAILNGDTETGNSVIQMTPGLDAGPCLAQQSTPIGPDETAEHLEIRLAEMGALLVAQVVDQLESGLATPVAQNTTLSTKAPRLTKEHGAIDWGHFSRRIKNQVQALIPWPRAYTFWHRAEGEPLRLNIDRVRLAESTDSAPPGTVLTADGQLIIRTGDGALELLDVQPAGKRRMTANEFLRGNRVQSGERLGPS